jgi:hypothetical protein
MTLREISQKSHLCVESRKVNPIKNRERKERRLAGAREEEQCWRKGDIDPRARVSVRLEG